MYKNRQLFFYGCLFFVAKAQQVQSCLHEIVFAGRKSMEHVVRNVTFIWETINEYY